MRTDVHFIASAFRVFESPRTNFSCTLNEKESSFAPGGIVLWHYLVKEDRNFATSYLVKKKLPKSLIPLRFVSNLLS
jgi:hypothetical protein